MQPIYRLEDLRSDWQDRCAARIEEAARAAEGELSGLLTADGEALEVRLARASEAAEREARGEAWALLRLLPERHRQVLVRRYGMGGGPPQSHKEVGDWLGVKEERSRQLEREALHRLRELASPAQRAA